MTGYVLSPLAQLDLDEIWNYTAARWSHSQAERYLRDICQAIEVVAGDPRRAKACDEIRPGYRKFSVGTHVWFFRTLGDGIDVVRILHQRMDFARHI
jgi:toxin ParE1/3/4